MIQALIPHLSLRLLQPSRSNTCTAISIGDTPIRGLLGDSDLTQSSVSVLKRGNHD
jgi:hypothetical protein